MTRLGRAAAPKASARAAVCGGVLATVTMDAAMLAAGLLGGDAFSTPRLSLGAIGRWAADLARGNRDRRDMLARPSGRGDAALGLLAHYGTGVALTGAFLALPRDRPPTVRGATAYGIATSALPLLVMFPTMGYGCFGRRSGEAARLIRIMLLGHTAFGLGMGIGIAATRLPCVGRRAGRP